MWLQPLARLGAKVKGIDPAPENVAVAQAHAAHDPRLGPAGAVQYACCTIEDLARDEASRYHVVVASEVLEHVANPREFISCAASLLQVGARAN